MNNMRNRAGAPVRLWTWAKGLGTWLVTLRRTTAMVSRCATTVALLLASCPSAISWTAVPATVFLSGSSRQRDAHASLRAATMSRGRVRVLRMGAAEDAIEEEVRAMRASKIKQTLEEMSVATQGVYEVCSNSSLL